jgi:hypothetical protein
MGLAVDIDDMLADQIGAVLWAIEKEYDLKYLKAISIVLTEHL